MTLSSTVTTGSAILASEYNNLRADVMALTVPIRESAFMLWSGVDNVYNNFAGTVWGTIPTQSSGTTGYPSYGILPQADLLAGGTMYLEVWAISNPPGGGTPFGTVGVRDSSAGTLITQSTIGISVASAWTRYISNGFAPIGTNALYTVQAITTAANHYLHLSSARLIVRK